MYLLNRSHPVGGPKADFFLRFGFSLENWRLLADALRRHAVKNLVVETNDTPHGRRYVIDGPLEAPIGVTLNVRAAWYIDAGGETPRFVTAHPLPKL